MRNEKIIYLLSKKQDQNIMSYQIMLWFCYREYNVICDIKPSLTSLSHQLVTSIMINEEQKFDIKMTCII